MIMAIQGKILSDIETSQIAEVQSFEQANANRNQTKLEVPYTLTNHEKKKHKISRI